MPIYMTAQYKVDRFNVEHCKKAIQYLVDHVRENEPGIKLYLAQQDILEPTSFFHLIIFEDEVALKNHQSSKASERFVNTVYPMALNPLEFKEYNPVAGNLNLFE